MPRLSPTTEERGRIRADEFFRRLTAYVSKWEAETGKEFTNLDLGMKAGIDRSTVSRIVNGKRPATLDQILAIAKALGDPSLVPPEASAEVAPGDRMSSSLGMLSNVEGINEFVRRNGTNPDSSHVPSAALTSIPTIPMV